MNRPRLISGVCSILLLSAASLAQDVAPESKDPGRNDAAGEPSKEQLFLVFNEALGTIKAMEDETSNRRNVLSLDSLDEETRCETLLAIGAVFARIGLVETSRKTWQEVL